MEKEIGVSVFPKKWEKKSYKLESYEGLFT